MNRQELTHEGLVSIITSTLDDVSMTDAEALARELSEERATDPFNKPGEEHPEERCEFDFWRCSMCGAVMTLDEERVNVVKGVGCKCGSLKYKPTFPRGEEWFQANVLRYALRKMKGEVTPPKVVVEEPVFDQSHGLRVEDLPSAGEL